MTWILTASGKHMDFTDPQPNQIDVLDIVQGLANECRYAGQCKAFYSVAQHSVLTSYIVPKAFALEALLHDATEAYCKDIPRPLKALLPDYQAIEQRVDAVIRARFGLPETPSFEVKKADLILLATERRDLMPHDATAWPSISGIIPLERRITAVPAGRAYAQFMRRFIEIIQGES